MKINKNILILVFIVPVLIAGTINTNSKELVDAKLTSHFNVSYCQSNKPKTEILVTIGLGNIKKTDSLYGFNFSINYDRSKLYFNSQINVNTLSEFASMKDISFGIEKNKILGYAINNSPLYGNKELIGFYGEYIGDLCDDSAYVEIEYIEFTDEFQKEVNKLDTIWIKPVRAELDYSIKPNFINDKYDYDSTITNVLPLELNTNNVKYLDYVGFNISAQNSSYKLDYINLNEDYILNKIDQDNSSLNIILQNTNSSNIKNYSKLLDIILTRTINETDTNSKIIVKPLELSDCNCFDYTKVSSDSIKINYIQNISTNVEDNVNNLNLKYLNGFLYVTEGNENINSIQLFNSVGELLVNDDLYSKNYHKYINLSNGVYFGLLRSDKHVISKKILVNY